MIQLIVFDIDGTLRDERYGIPSSAKTAIVACRAQGYQLALCTGRNMASIQQDVKQLSLPHVIASGGCYIESEGNLLATHFFPQADIDAILQYATQVGFALSIEATHSIFMNQAACELLGKMNAQKASILQGKALQAFRQNQTIPYKNNMHMYQKEAIHKLCIWCNGAQYESIQQLLSQGFAIAQQKQMDKFNYYELLPTHCGKAEAIHCLCASLHIPMSDVLAFGDGCNDASMLAHCGVGVAMKDSDETLFHYADSICETAMQDGIYQELRRRELI